MIEPLVIYICLVVNKKLGRNFSGISNVDLAGVGMPTVNRGRRYHSPARAYTDNGSVVEHGGNIFIR